MRVLIVGAGPTGLTAAVELARLGITPTIIDKRETPSGLSRAVGILPRSLELLAPSGVTERLVREGMVMRRALIHAGTRLVLTLPLDAVPTRATGQSDADPDNADSRSGILALAQDRTELALRDALVGMGGDVEFGRELTDIRQRGDRVIATISDAGGAGEHDYDYAIGADGVDSTTRRSLGLSFPGHDLPETWSIADVDVSAWPYRDAFTLCLVPGGRVAVIAPLEPRRCRVISNTEDALATLPLEMDMTNVRRRGDFRISIRQVRSYNVGRVFLAGDAAHCQSPVGGRGMNLGIDDAADLAARLAAEDRETRLAGYSEARHAVGAETIALSERARRTLATPGRVKRLLVRLSCRVIGAVPPLQRVLVRRVLLAGA